VLLNMFPYGASLDAFILLFICVYLHWRVDCFYLPRDDAFSSVLTLPSLPFSLMCLILLKFNTAFRRMYTHKKAYIYIYAMSCTTKQVEVYMKRLLVIEHWGDDWKIVVKHSTIWLGITQRCLLIYFCLEVIVSLREDIVESRKHIECNNTRNILIQ
jgi:hypothetical protein